VGSFGDGEVFKNFSKKQKRGAQKEFPRFPRSKKDQVRVSVSRRLRPTACTARPDPCCLLTATVCCVQVASQGTSSQH
jgi:hypothetical protein